MKEVKTPKKPLIFYYAVAMLAVFLFNFLAIPWLAQHQIKEVDYNTFVGRQGRNSGTGQPHSLYR